MGLAGKRPPGYVVDASVGVKLVIEEELSPQAAALFATASARGGLELHAPDLFFLECASVLWKYARHRGYPPDKARRDLRELGALGLEVCPGQALAGDALALGLELGVTPYDACYLALAHRLKLPLVTADERLVNKVGRGPIACKWLGAIPYGVQ